MLNKDTSINWIDHEILLNMIKIYLFIFLHGIITSSWINYNFKCPYLIISYEELVYDKEK